MKKAFDNKWVLCSTRQPSNLRQMLVKAKFILNPPPREPILYGLFPCGHCSCCKQGLISYSSEFEFIDGFGSKIIWVYNRKFSCASRNVIYILKCTKCSGFYLGKTDDTTQRCRKHASDVRHPENSNCQYCSEHLRDCSKLIFPYFKMYPFFYVDDPSLRHFMERRFIIRWKPPLNSQ